jgi:sarcosine oxidase delta subunit
MGYDRCAYCGEWIEGHAFRTAGDAPVHPACLDDIRSNSTAYQYLRDHTDVLLELLHDHKDDTDLDGFWSVVQEECGGDVERWATDE